MAFVGAAVAAVMMEVQWTTAELACISGLTAISAVPGPAGINCVPIVAKYKAIFVEQEVLKLYPSSSCAKYTEYRALDGVKEGASQYVSKVNQFVQQSSLPNGQHFMFSCCKYN